MHHDAPRTWTASALDRGQEPRASKLPIEAYAAGRHIEISAVNLDTYDANVGERGLDFGDGGP